MQLAIALPIFDRLEFVRRTIPALLAARGTANIPIFVGFEGPRKGKIYEGGDLAATRKYVRGALAPHEGAVQYLAREEHVGMSDNIVDVTNRAFCEFNADAVVVLEDDILVSRDFLTFTRRCLERYADNRNVFAVTGSCTYCSEGTTDPHCYDPHWVRSCAWWLTIGWAIWRNRWGRFFPQYAAWKRDRAAWTRAAWERIAQNYVPDVRRHLARNLFRPDGAKIINERWGGVINVCRAAWQRVIVAPWAARSTHIGWYGENTPQAKAARMKSTAEHPWYESKCFKDDWHTEDIDLVFADDEEIARRAEYQGFA